MSDDIHAHWHSTDDGAKAPEPARIVPSQEQPAAKPAQVQVTHALPQTAQKKTLPAAHVRIDPPRASMKLAALTGIGIVLAASGTFYFGTDFLRAELAQSTVEEVVVTAEGTFEPNDVTLSPGDSLTITNKHADPQVIKTRIETAGIDPQVLFQNENVTIDVPDNMPAGDYEFFSETLPENESLVIHIVTSTEEEPEAAEDNFLDDIIDDGALMTNDILIPDLSEVAAEEQANTQAPSSSVAAATNQNQLNSGGLELALHGSASDATQETFTNTGNLPTNPYTVGNALQNPVPEKNLHGGAPLLNNRPRSQPSTGMSEWLFITLASTIGLFAFWKAGKMNTKIDR